jgi:hypothetical protein
MTEEAKQKHWSHLVNAMAQAKEHACPRKPEACFTSDENGPQTLAAFEAYAPRIERLREFTRAAQCEERYHFSAFHQFAAEEFRLMLAAAAIARRGGRTDEAIATLQGAVRFRVAASACGRALVAAMIANAQSVQIGRVVNAWLDAYPQDASKLNATLGSALFDLEAQLQPALARATIHEFALKEQIMADMVRNGFNVLGHQTWTQRMWHRFGAFFFLRQATENDSAALATAWERWVVATPARWDEAVTQYQREVATVARPEVGLLTFLFSRNGVGKVLHAIALPSYEDIVLRTHDAVSSLRLVSVKLSALAGGNSATPAQALGAAGFNPHTDAPFAWDANTRTLSFTPKQRSPNERSTLVSVKL